MPNRNPPSDPGFYDLFVSYSTKDNQPPPGEHEGWVQVFIQRVRDLAKVYTNENLTTTASVQPRVALLLLQTCTQPPHP